MAIFFKKKDGTRYESGEVQTVVENGELKLKPKTEDKPKKKKSTTKKSTTKKEEKVEDTPADDEEKAEE